MRQQQQQRQASGQTVQTGQSSGGSQQGAQQMGQQQSTVQGLEFPTSSRLPQQVRREVIQELNRTLADTTVLLTHARFAHWNVKGMAFYGLHELFEDIYEMFEEHVDLIGERITALGGQALGTAGLAVQNCRIPAMPTTIISGQEFVQVLAERLSVHDEYVRRAITTATEMDDPDSADLLNEISREVSQMLWFLDAHFQTQPISTGGAPAQEGQQGMGGQQRMEEQQGAGHMEEQQGAGQMETGERGTGNQGSGQQRSQQPTMQTQPGQ